MSQVRIQPVPGRTVFMPERNYQPVPAEGATVAMSNHYRRAIADGDLELVNETAAQTVSDDAGAKARKSNSGNEAK